MEKSAKTNRVIILKGSPGVGKSFTARKLVSQLKSKKIALISIDELLHTDQRNLCEDKLKLAKYNAAILTRSFLSDKFDIIIEYTFDIPNHLEFLIDKIKHSHVNVLPKSDIHIFHLTAKFAEVKKRNKTRKDGTDPLPDSILEKLYKSCEITAGKIEGEVIIETDKLPLKKVVEKIIEQFK
jgi:tRNA uridine 5-carbamoylmethylation protein Kti12